MDFDQVFDKVSHACLLHKLDFYGVRENPLNWVAGFLGNR